MTPVSNPAYPAGNDIQPQGAGKQVEWEDVNPQQ